MISKNKFKYLKSLKIKKYRTQAKQILIEGRRLIAEAIKSGARIDLICCTEQFISNLDNKQFLLMVENKNIPIEEISNLNMDELSESVTNQGLIGLANINISNDENRFTYPNQLILDSISNPGNLGNIIRTLDWFGIDKLYLSHNCTDIYNSKVIRSAMGAHFYIDIVQIDILEHIAYLKQNNFSIIAADIEGESIYDWNFPEKWAIILGNEAHGISDKVRKLIDYKITVPKVGNVESLNVSMAAGIIVSHIKKI